MLKRKRQETDDIPPQINTTSLTTANNLYTEAVDHREMNKSKFYQAHYYYLKAMTEITDKKSIQYIECVVKAFICKVYTGFFVTDDADRAYKILIKHINNLIQLSNDQHTTNKYNEFIQLLDKIIANHNNKIEQTDRRMSGFLYFVDNTFTTISNNNQMLMNGMHYDVIKLNKIKNEIKKQEEILASILGMRKSLDYEKPFTQQQLLKYVLKRIDLLDADVYKDKHKLSSTFSLHLAASYKNAIDLLLIDNNLPNEIIDNYHWYIKVLTFSIKQLKFVNNNTVDCNNLSTIAPIAYKLIKSYSDLMTRNPNKYASYKEEANKIITEFKLDNESMLIDAVIPTSSTSEDIVTIENIKKIIAKLDLGQSRNIEQIAEKMSTSTTTSTIANISTETTSTKINANTVKPDEQISVSANYNTLFKNTINNSAFTLDHDPLYNILKAFIKVCTNNITNTKLAALALHPLYCYAAYLSKYHYRNIEPRKVIESKILEIKKLFGIDDNHFGFYFRSYIDTNQTPNEVVMDTITKYYDSLKEILNQNEIENYINEITLLINKDEDTENKYKQILLNSLNKTLMNSSTVQNRP